MVSEEADAVMDAVNHVRDRLPRYLGDDERLSLAGLGVLESLSRYDPARSDLARYLRYTGWQRAMRAMHQCRRRETPATDLGVRDSWLGDSLPEPQQIDWLLVGDGLRPEAAAALRMSVDGGMSRAEVAAAMGVHKRTVARWFATIREANA